MDHVASPGVRSWTAALRYDHGAIAGRAIFDVAGSVCDYRALWSDSDRTSLQIGAGRRSQTLLSTASAIILAYAISAMALLPCFYYMFAFEAPHGLIFSPWGFSIDLVNFFIPTSINQLGALPIFSGISYPYRAELAEATGYISLPSIAIVILFARERWHDWRGRFVVCMFAIACVLAMGPLLQVLGHFLLPLPAVVLTLVPLFDKALPSRFMMYAYLTLAVMVAMWLAEGNERATVRWAFGLAIVPFMLPNLSTSFWTTPAEIPAFFSSGLYRQYLAPGEAVLVLPFGLFGEGMLWQAAIDMYFRMAGGTFGSHRRYLRKMRAGP
jgi:hypothetical protein